MMISIQKARIEQNHRIIECFGLEGTLKITQVQYPCHGPGQPPLEQVAQGPIQSGGKLTRETKITSFTKYIFAKRANGLRYGQGIKLSLEENIYSNTMVLEGKKGIFLP